MCIRDRFGNGNYVLTEFVMEVAHPDKPNEWQAVPFSSVKSYFDQSSHPVVGAIDGVTKGTAGWAQYPMLGKSNWATFQLKLPAGYTNGTLVRFKMYQDFDPIHQIGRFRISLTKYSKRSGLGLSEELLADISQPDDKLSDERKKLFATLFKRDDPKLVALNAALASAKTPLKIPAEIVGAREQLARAEEPIPPDFKLTQLEKDLKMSQSQLKNERLTAAHDLAWALINSPSFLFNR